MSIADIRTHLETTGHKVLNLGTIDTEIPHCFVAFGGGSFTNRGLKLRAAVTVVGATLDENDPSVEVQNAVVDVFNDLCDVSGWLPASIGPVAQLDNSLGYGSVMFGAVIQMEEA